MLENNIREAEKSDVWEETIVFGKRTFTYSLSNSLANIKTAINLRMGTAIANLATLENKNAWRVNTELSKKVEVIMSRRDVEYSMTIYVDTMLKDAKFLVLNRRVNNGWLFCHGILFQNAFFATELGEAEKLLEAEVEKILLRQETLEDCNE